MITAVNTNVRVDIFRSDAPHHSQSRELLRTAYDAGAIIICDIVYAELVPESGGRATLDGALRQINATLSAIDTSIAYEAGVRRMQYRAAGGPRERTIPGFIIGAHAVAVADTLLTQDRGFYATYFPELKKP